MVFYQSFIYAQSDSIKTCSYVFKGHIYDGYTKNPLIGATVFFPLHHAGTATNSDGVFKVDNLCKDTYTVKISYVGYKSIEIPIVLAKDIHLDFSLFSDTSALGSVVVEGKRQDLFAVSQPISTLEGKELDKTRGLPLGEALKQIPGMFTFQTGPSISKPVLHGMHGNRLLIMNAGLRQEAQQWGAEHAPEIDPFISNRLAVIKGASGLRYGSDAISGVILVEPRSLSKIHGVGGEINLGAFSNNRMGVGSAMVEGNFEKVPELKWRLQGSYKYAGSAAAPNYVLSNTAFREDNFSAGLGFIKKNYEVDVYYSRFHTQLGILPDAQASNENDVVLAIDRARPKTIEPFTYVVNRGFQNVSHDLLRIKFDFSLGSIGKITAILGSQWNFRQEYDRHKPLKDSLKESPQYEYSLTTYSAELVFEHHQRGRFNGLYGILLQDKSNRWSGTRFLIPDYNSQGYGAFAMEKWKKDHLEIEAGIRYDLKTFQYAFNKFGVISHSDHQFQNFSANLGLNYQFSSALTLKYNSGFTFRPPNASEMFVNGQVEGSVFVEIGDPKLKAEKGYKSIASIEYKSAKLSFESSIHYTYIHDNIYLRPTLLFRESVRGKFLEYAYTQTNASFYGIDLSAVYSLTPQIDLIAKGSAVNAYNETFQKYLVYIPPYRGEVAAKWQPWFVPIFKRNDVYVQVTASFVAKQSRVDLSSDFAPPPDGYSLLALEVGADMKVGKQKWIVTLQANNIFNTSYRDYMNRYRYFADEPGRNFVLRLKIPLSIYSPKN